MFLGTPACVCVCVCVHLKDKSSVCLSPCSTQGGLITSQDASVSGGDLSVGGLLQSGDHSFFSL